jgi:hypothetical protein
MLRIIMTFAEQRLGSLITVTPIGMLCSTVNRVLEICSNFCCGSGFLPCARSSRRMRSLAKGGRRGTRGPWQHAATIDRITHWTESKTIAVHTRELAAPALWASRCLQSLLMEKGVRSVVRTDRAARTVCGKL